MEKYHSYSLYRGIYQKTYETFDQFTSLPKSVRETLKENFVIDYGEIIVFAF